MSFALLGLADTATPEEVKARWRELASTHHPDRGGDAAEFNRYRQAYNEALAEASAPKPCETCGGSGKVMAGRGFSAIKVVCPTCQGDGLKP